MSAYTIWIVDKARLTAPDVSVCDARSVTDAMKQALERVARKRKSHPLELKILGVAEGDIRILDWENGITPLRQ
jgi:hypothetical protein